MKKNDFMKKLEEFAILGGNLVLINGWKVIHTNDIDNSFDINSVNTIEKCYLIKDENCVSLEDGTIVEDVVIL